MIYTHKASEAYSDNRLIIFEAKPITYGPFNQAEIVSVQYKHLVLRSGLDWLERWVPTTCN